MVGKIDSVTLVTAGVAVYGAILSTYNTIAKWAENKRTLEVKIRIGGDLESPRIYLSAANTGKRVVVLNDYCLLSPNKKRITYEDMWFNGILPDSLTEGSGFQAWTPAGELALALRSQGLSGKIKLVAAFTDALGTRYCSTSIFFPIDKYADEARERKKKEDEERSRREQEEMKLREPRDTL